jgi:parvulin-like peptidyl-prolyl isomerase
MDSTRGVVSQDAKPSLPRRAPSTLGKLVLFLLLGALLQLVVRFGDDGSGSLPVVTVTEQDVSVLVRGWEQRTGRRPTAEMTERLIAQEVDDRLMIQEARRIGWHRTDPVIQRRLLMNQRFVEPDSDRSDAERLEAAYEQGMDETDIVVRRRLIERMRLAIAQHARLEAPTEAELEAYRAKNEELFSKPGRVAINQIFLSADRRGESLERDALAVGERVSKIGFDSAIADELSDPSLLPRKIGPASRDELARQFGATFADLAFGAPEGRWTGPIASSYGLHFVWVHTRAAQTFPPLEEIRAQVLSRVQREREDAAVASFKAGLRRSTTIQLPTGAAPVGQ